MEQTIQNQLSIIEKSNKWILSFLDGEKQKNAYRFLVNYRRRLNKTKFAIESNPAAAIYGASQVGKSYLVGSLLSELGKPFTIIDGNQQEHDFIKKINPIGKRTESTSLVTRFSTNYEWINPSFPVKAKLLSPADIILVLCDSYYNDVKVKSDLVLRINEINDSVYRIIEKFQSRGKNQQIILEDDILDIQDYFEKNFSNQASRITDSIFFSEIPSIIEKISLLESIELFALLWNNNSRLTKMLEELFILFEKIKFAREVYLPFEAILREYGTILDVERLHEIYGSHKGIESNYKSETSLMFFVNGQEKVINDFSKSYLCALTAELVFKLPPNLENTKPFLNKTDLLDFPGARNRLGIHEEDLTTEHIPKMLLRGKVAYLFNKYSDLEKINILLFCQNNEKSEVQNILPQLVDDWITKMIGKNSIERDKFISKSVVPPFFVVSTMFNIDLQYDFNNDTIENKDFRESRWKRRFFTVFNEVFGSKNWINQWTVNVPNFQNIYLLRDFNYSSETESKLFTGYNEHKYEVEEIVPQNYTDFRKDLRKSFIENDFVKSHFENPVLAWDAAASINNDGTNLIIEKLSDVANNINEARREKILAELNAISESIKSELQKYFHSNDKDEELRKAKSIAGEIQQKLDTAFRADGIKMFGHLLKELLIHESAVLDVYRKQIDSIEHRDVVNLDIYSNYRIQVPVIDGDTIDSYFTRLCAHYEKNTVEQIEEFKEYLESEGVDLEELISNSSGLIKNNAQQLSETLVEYWFAHVSISNKQTIQKVLGGDNSNSLQEMIGMYQKIFKKTRIANRIAERIRRFIDGHNKTDIPFEIIADMSAEILNNCIKGVGFEYYDDSEINDLRLANEENRLGLKFDHDVSPLPQSVGELFDKIDKRSELIQTNLQELLSTPSYRNYLAWYNRIKIGFVSVCNIPNYNAEANKVLGSIINEAKMIKY